MKLFRNLWAREAPANTSPTPICHFFDPQAEASPWPELLIHIEEQNKECSGWQRLNELIDQAASDGREEFSPEPEMAPSEWAQITELPRTISKLKHVKH